MSRQTKYLNALALACALSLPLFVQAHEGHDDAPPAASGESPRRQSDGSVFIPKSAQRQLGLRTLAVTRVGEGLYQAELSQPLADGETPVTATVVAGADSDLLAADIDWHAPATAAPPSAWAGKSRLALAGGAVLLALAVLWAWSRRTQRTGGAA